MRFLVIIISILNLQFRLVAKDSLILWINFDEISFDKSQGKFLDQSPHKNEAYLFGKIDFSEDRFNNSCGAFNFKNKTYLSILNSNSLSSPKEEITISAWIKLNQGAKFFDEWMTIICKGNDRLESWNSPQYRMQATAQTASLNTALVVNVIPPIDYETWYHYAYVLKDNFFRIYLNGNLISETYFNLMLEPNDFPLEIGRDMPGAIENLNGSLDDLKIFNKGLEPLEIKKLFNENNSKHLTCSKQVVKREFEKKVIQNNQNPNLDDELPIEIQDTIFVKSKSLMIYPYDNNKLDYDSVSIYLNGSLVVESILLERKRLPIPVEKLFPIQLLDNKGDNYLVAKALNLGNEPPNTMTLRILDGFKEQEVKLNSTLKSNGAIVIKLE